MICAHVPAAIFPGHMESAQSIEVSNRRRVTRCRGRRELGVGRRLLVSSVGSVRAAFKRVSVPLIDQARLG